MLKLIASDLCEFASLVKDDTAAAVNIVRKDAMSAFDTLDATMGRPVPSEAQREAECRMTIPEVYSTPLPQVHADTTANSNSANVNSFEEFETTELAFFLEAFDINEKTEEISSLLQQNEHLRALFEELVPIDVSYEEFWRRHFYRCDADRIQRAWDVHERLGTDPSVSAFSSVVSGVLLAPVRLASQPLSALRKVVIVDRISGSEPRGVTNESNRMLLDAQKEVAILQSALGISNDRISALRFSVDELKNDFKNERRINAELTIEVALLKKQLQQKNEKMKYLTDQFLVTVGQPAPSQPKHFDVSGRTDPTESSSSESTTDHHIGTCVTLQAVSRDKSPPGKQSVWNLPVFGNWGVSESESSIPDGWGSEDEESSLSDQIARIEAS